MEVLARLANLPGALPGACAQGLIWGIMAIGVYLTYRILDVADLTVDNSFATGGAVCVMALLSGQNVWAALVMAFIAGLACGLVTGLLHTFMGIPAILAGILTQLALYSINLKIMGKANQSINVDKYDLLISLRWVKEFALHNPVIMVILITAVLIGILYWFFGTELGCAIRATGSNPHMSRAQGINTDFNVVLGLMVSNGLVALSGALLAQYQGFADVSMLQPRVPQLRPQADGGVHRRRDLLYRPAAGADTGFRRQPPQAAVGCGGGRLPGGALLEGQIFLEAGPQEGAEKWRQHRPAAAAGGLCRR